jgi:hypothetical protein
VAAPGPERLVVAVRGADRHLYWMSFDHIRWSGWNHVWQELSEQPAVVATNPLEVPIAFRAGGPLEMWILRFG